MQSRDSGPGNSERLVLARAVKAHIEGRVLLDGTRTVVVLAGARSQAATGSRLRRVRLGFGAGSSASTRSRRKRPV